MSWIAERKEGVMIALNEHIAYTSQSPVTDPGDLVDRLDAVPGDLVDLQRAARQLVFHYRGDGDFAQNGIAAERSAEIDTRYADRMLRRLVELHDVPLGSERLPHQRLVGCCRDFTVLFLAMARRKGMPARARVGFATYFAAGWNVDHEVAEVWDAEQRWRLVDPELHEGHRDPTDGAEIDPLDVPADRFIVAPRAWLACRAGAADPARFLVDPGLDIPQTRSWPYLVHNVLHDLAALHKQEMVLWDSWGLAESDELSAEQLDLLDRVAEVMVSGTATVDDLRELYDRAELQVPPVVTSYSPAAEAPLRVATAR
jgi:hypothetical protein